MVVFYPGKVGSNFMLECGVDLIEIKRIETAVQRLGERFLNRIFTENERDYCQGQPARLAARFAAKEATAKVLGTGLWRDGITWQQIEVINEESGKPNLLLNGEAAELANRLGFREWRISLSHSRGEAVAFVVATG